MANTNAHILFVDDEPAMLRSLVRNIESPLLTCHQATTADEAKRTAALHKPAVCVVDLSLDPQRGPDSGLELVSELLASDSTLRVLVLTGHASDEYGIKALHAGAASFLAKPVDIPLLKALIDDALHYAELKRHYRSLTSGNTSTFTQLTGLASASDKMQSVLESAAFAAATNQPLLITGETGVGKGVLAHAIHRASDNRRGAFIRFQPNFGSSDLVSSELFGHQKGAFTGAHENRVGLVEEANGGSLFIDEIDSLPHETQVLLLNVLQERVFRRVGSNKEQKSDFRLIAATNRPLLELLKSEKIREDFYHRIAHLTIEIPPLRERSEDLPLLAEQFVRELANREKLPVQGLAPGTLGKLAAHPWPGNIRELHAALEGAIYRAAYENRRFIEAQDVIPKTNGKLTTTSGNSFREKVQNFEVDLIRQALEKHDDNQSKAAASLELDRSTLRRILARE